MKKILPPTLMWISIIVMVFLRWLAPLDVFYTMPWNLIGLIPTGFGITVMMAAWINFKQAKTNVNPFGQPDRFVVAGPYRFSRNPMYLGFGLILAGVWLLLGVLSPLLCVIAFFVIIDRAYIPFEERQMQNKFGEDYEAYCSRTERWITL